MRVAQRLKGKRPDLLKKKAESQEQLFGAAIGSRGYVKNVIRNERQHGSYMLIIRKVGINSQTIDTIETME